MSRFSRSRISISHRKPDRFIVFETLSPRVISVRFENVTSTENVSIFPPSIALTIGFKFVLKFRSKFNSNVFNLRFLSSAIVFSYDTRVSALPRRLPCCRIGIRRKRICFGGLHRRRECGSRSRILTQSSSSCVIVHISRAHYTRPAIPVGENEIRIARTATTENVWVRVRSRATAYITCNRNSTVSTASYKTTRSHVTLRTRTVVISYPE